MKTYADISGDGGSGVVEQITALQAEISRRFATIGKMIAVGSAKGGVGKSTLTHYFASALKQQGRKVGLLDLDINGPSLSVIAGVENSPLVPGNDGLIIPRNHQGIPVLSFGTFLEKGYALEFGDVSANGMHHWRATKEFSTLADILAHSEWGELDFLLIDLPPGAEKTAQYLSFFGESLALILVTIPSDVSYKVVERGIHALRGLPNKILGYVENMDGYYCSDCSEVKPLFHSNSKVELAIPRLGSIPFSPEVSSASNHFDTTDFSSLNREIADKVMEIVKTVFGNLKSGQDEISLC